MPDRDYLDLLNKFEVAATALRGWGDEKKGAQAKLSGPDIPIDTLIEWARRLGEVARRLEVKGGDAPFAEFAAASYRHFPQPEMRHSIEHLRMILSRSEPLTPEEQRNKFCFEEWERGQTYKQINVALKNNSKWEQFADDRSVRGAINAWSKKIDVVPRKGQRGRPKSSK